MLRGSAFITTHVRVAKEAHGYCEGSQHVRKTRYLQRTTCLSVRNLSDGLATPAASKSHRFFAAAPTTT
jgi:hypothetical protein